MPTLSQEVSPASQNSKKRNDIILIAMILVAVLVIGVCLLLFQTEGDTVVVRVDGKVYGEYALEKNQTVEIVTEWGRNLLVIENGRAFVTEASCPDGICVAERSVAYTWQSIICKPNRMVVEIRLSEENQPDIII